MSAYLVSPEHIAQLALRFKKQVPFAGAHNVDALSWAKALAEANWNSVAYRYGDDDMRYMGSGMSKSEYIYAACAATKNWDYNLNALDLIKMAKCFEYQACEKPDWDVAQYDSNYVGAWHINYFVSAMLYKIPGYEEAKRDYEIA